MRFPLATDIKTAISDSTVGERLFNAHTERRGAVDRVKKRPGAVATGWNFTTPIQGLLGGSLLYLIYDDQFSSVDVDNPPANVPIGTLVGGYYAMIDNPPTAPGPGDDYWSATPPGATRYKSAMAIEYDSSTYRYTMHPTGDSPYKDQLQGVIGASKEATVKSLQAVVDALGSVIFWPYLQPYPPYGPGGGAVFRALPIGLSAFGTSSIINTDCYISNSTTMDWTAGIVASDIPAVGGLLGYPAFDWGVVRAKTTTSGVTITSTGSVAKILFSDLSPHASLTASIWYIEVSGANEPEYNGVFQCYLTTNPLIPATSLPFPFYLYYDMTGTPASSTATGSVSVDHYL